MRYYWPLACLSLLACTSVSRADLIVSIGDLTLAPGGAGFVDVQVRSDNADVLDIFAVSFRITPIGLPTGRLEFVTPPVDGHLSDPDYIFFNNSEGFGGLVDTTTTTNDTYDGGDVALNPLGVLVPATDTLLVRLHVTAAPGNAQPGEQFRINLLGYPASSFLTPGESAATIAFGANFGTVTIAPVPEPGSLMLLGAIAAGGIGYCQRRRVRQVG